MKPWLRPSLLRRTVLALLAALLLVWVVLSLKDFWTFKQDVRDRESFGKIARATLNALQGLDEPQARVALLAADRQYNELRRNAENAAPGALLFQLRSAQGRVVYESEGGMPPDAAGDSRSGETEHRGIRYWVMEQEDARWRLVVWVPVMSDATAMALIGRDILGYLLLALPFVVLPMALAVWLGLRPLRSLTRQIARRPPDDLTPLQEPTGYVELAPLVEAANVLLERSRHQRELEQSFVQDAAHELKTPLAVVAAQAHVLAHARDEAQRQVAQQALEQGVQRASHQVNQLLMLAALEHATLKPPQAVDLVEMARETLIELEPLASGRGSTLALQSPDQMVESVDTEALRLALVNLVRNAIQHGADAGSVEVSLKRQGGRVNLEVADDGPGIPAHERLLVFDRFYRSGSSGSKGSGLGLAIVQRAAQRLNAQVSIADRPGGQGTVFMVTWPAAA
ncbi:sensor histidine kinase [Hydrogenophaga pseudoflava]|uniref:sensor histidine kinase n=1 Tax=Hydrogenophaga pseudoflava TaxID=47421 RepID=UPI0027E560B9|nr:HAMP domain-containing sensor histidine kinase [Hydrogenophaga pseudoflava]MDQ7745593.1 HAMP domain-containing sensor histidine kinase [Hydrogenophaga pseudoflava]